jgi:hypothetical protein
MLQDLTDRNSLLDIAIQHETYKIDAFFAHDPGYSEVMVHDFVYAVERVLFVDDGVE